ncbi:hypothetical protein P3T36_000346 [Kitasatospora sp. MAP12-15]|uniref:hypothetical protein n=1 Tax=unclassified Kitasatospora TaxID=2633591 RepID=UPI002474E17C|nr:hypothetical protein [Kitasatospora sp. MAP12-44]MDH6109575.1 hypothetical protein [Kitasatospora sp. MAP12-44]
MADDAVHESATGIAPARPPEPVAGRPDTTPAHARPGLLHWSVVLAACVAVVAAALAGGSASGTVTAAPTGAPEPVPTAQAPDPAQAVLPLDCGPFPVKVSVSFAADLGDGTPSTVVAAHCDADNGTPPDGVFVLGAGADGHPVVRDTLVSWQENLTVTRLALRSDGVLTAQARGYSTAAVPRCCPDLTVSLNWTRKGGSYVRTQTSAPSATA